MKNILPGKKTYIFATLTFIALALSYFLPGEVSSDDLRIIYDEGEAVYVTAKRDLWPLLTGLFTTIMTAYSRAIAKPKY